MINVIIVDDEKNCVDALEKMLHRCEQDIHIIGSAGTVESAINLINKHSSDLHILFLDIHIPGGNGFNVIKNLPASNFKIVFTTAFDQYAINAIRFSALDYLLKPIDPIELQASLHRFDLIKQENKTEIAVFKEKLIKNKTFEKLAIPTLTDISFIDLAEIIYFESDKNYTTIYLTNGEKIISSKNLGYYEEILLEYGFIRIHHYYIINITKIKKYIKAKTGLVELTNGTKLGVSARRKEAFFKLLNLQ